MAFNVKEVLAKAQNVGKMVIYAGTTPLPYVSEITPPPVEFIEVEGGNSTSSGNATMYDPTRIDGTQNEGTISMIMADMQTIGITFDPQEIVNLRVVCLVNTIVFGTNRVLPVPLTIEMQVQFGKNNLGAIKQSSKLDFETTFRCFNMTVKWNSIEIFSCDYDANGYKFQGNDALAALTQILG